jgi:hypothetical protein
MASMSRPEATHEDPTDWGAGGTDEQSRPLLPGATASQALDVGRWGKGRDRLPPLGFQPSQRASSRSHNIELRNSRRIIRTPGSGTGR